MESLYLLIPLSIALTFAIGAVFWWATRSGQFDDREGPAHRILMDDDRAPPVTREVNASANTPPAESTPAAEERE